MQKKIIMVALGGSLGAMLRYSFILAFPHNTGDFPLTIFLENITGSFLLGFVFVFLSKKWKPSWPARAFFGTGLLGSFTTFSNFSIDLVNLINSGNLHIALSYWTLSVVLGLAAGFAGMMLAGKQIGRRS